MAESISTEHEGEFPRQGRSRRQSSADDQHRHRKLHLIVGILSILGAIYLTVALATFDKWDPSFFTLSSRPTHNYGGPVGAYMSDLITAVMGLPGYLVPLILIIFGVRKILGRERNLFHVGGIVLLLPSLSMLVELISETAPRTFEISGGMIGLLLSDLLQELLSVVGAYIFCIALISVSIILLSPVSLFSFIAERKSGKKKKEEPAEEIEEPEPEFSNEEPQEFTIREPLPRPVPAPRPVTRKTDEAGYRLPHIDFLKDADEVSGPTKEELTSAASGLERKLADFGVMGKIKQAHPGPVVTMFEFEPAAGVKINRIVSLADD
ncbi:MAG TPA: DNA translocase FtsK 4TM domain-containing protein, partial [Dissulfurispiraceae bacterium]|nr:DNA translocase FtsK 4TM domain-containing protein [Dissulfurispiraceae bacterium]